MTAFRRRRWRRRRSGSPSSVGAGGRWGGDRRAVPSRRIHFHREPSAIRKVVPSDPRPARPKVRLRVLGAVGVGLLSVMMLRLWYLQVLHTRKYRSQVVAEAYQPSQVPAPRGAIMDRTGAVLVSDTAQHEITLSRADAEQHPAVVSNLAAMLGVSQLTVQQALADPRYTATQQIPVATNATVAQLTTLAVHASLFPGVHAANVSVRQYPYGTTASHLLGYVTPISQAELTAYRNQGYLPGDPFGQSGVEAQYQQYLRGTPGSREVAVDRLGNPVRVVSTTPPKPGDTLVLNVDLGLQQALDQDLATEIASLHHQGFAAPSGAAVVMDPNTGAVLAMASYPTYNPSVWAGGISQSAYQSLTSAQNHEPLVNRAIAGLYTPGSTFKLATATAALDTGLITTSYTYDDATGTYTIPGCTGGGACTFHNSGYEHLGVINITPAIAASDDVFFYNLGVQFWLQRARYGQDPIQQMANAYSLGAGTGIDLPGAAPGFVDSPQVEQKLHQQYPAAYPYPQWYAGNNLEMAFGQGATIISPIELADAYSTFANGGTRYQPQVAAAVVAPDGHVVKRFAPVVTGHVPLSPQDHAAMLAGFEGAVGSSIGTAYGTFQGFPLSQFQVAGKTGTASVTTSTGVKLAPNSLFVGMGPEPSPQYVVAGVISQAGFGASGFAVVARNVFSYLMAHPVPPLTLPQSLGSSSGTQVAAGSPRSSGGASSGAASSGGVSSGGASSGGASSGGASSGGTSNRPSSGSSSSGGGSPSGGSGKVASGRAVRHLSALGPSPRGGGRFAGGGSVTVDRPRYALRRVV